MDVHILCMHYIGVYICSFQHPHGPSGDVGNLPIDISPRQVGDLFSQLEAYKNDLLNQEWFMYPRQCYLHDEAQGQ